MRSLALVILLGAAIPGTGWCQTEFGRPWGPRASLLFAGKPSQGMRLVLGDTDRPQVGPTYWKEGAIGGGVVLGLLGAYFFAEMCAYAETRDNCTGATIGGLMAGGAIGVSVGALIGGQFPKSEASRSPPDSIRLGL